MSASAEAPTRPPRPEEIAAHNDAFRAITEQLALIVMDAPPGSLAHTVTLEELEPLLVRVPGAEHVAQSEPADVQPEDKFPIMGDVGYLNALKQGEDDQPAAPKRTAKTASLSDEQEPVNDGDHIYDFDWDPRVQGVIDLAAARGLKLTNQEAMAFAKSDRWGRWEERFVMGKDGEYTDEVERVWVNPFADNPDIRDAYDFYEFFEQLEILRADTIHDRIKSWNREGRWVRRAKSLGKLAMKPVDASIDAAIAAAKKVESMTFDPKVVVRATGRAVKHWYQTFWDPQVQGWHKPEDSRPRF